MFLSSKTIDFANCATPMGARKIAVKIAEMLAMGQ